VDTVLQVVAVVYVDGILFFGPDRAITDFIDQLATASPSQADRLFERRRFNISVSWATLQTDRGLH
jgi:hypothetical protein